MRIINLFCCFVFTVGFGIGFVDAADTSAGSSDAWSLDRNSVPAASGEAVSLTINQPGRYAIWPSSSSGATITLVDPITGPGDESGKIGRLDGRVDSFLDTGVYRLNIDGDPRDAGPVTISVNRFQPATSSRESLPVKDIHTSTLNDLEMRHYWFTMNTKGPVHIQAAGRALGDMRLWHNGSWLMDTTPRISQSPGRTGQPLSVYTITTHLSAGTYCLSLYGCKPLDWAAGATSSPLYIRSGIPQCSPAGVMTNSVSIFGEDLYQVVEGPDFFRLESSTINLGMSIKPYQMNALSDGIDPGTRRIFNKNQPWIEYRNMGQFYEKLIRISGPVGAPYRLRWFPEKAYRSRVDISGRKTIQLYQGSDPRDTPPLHAVLFEENTKTKSVQAIAQATGLISEESSYMLSMNVKRKTILFVEFTGDGPVHLASRGAPVRYILEPFNLYNPKGYVPPLPQSFPGTAQVGAKIYQLTLLPDKPGHVDLIINDGSTGLDWNRFVPLMPDQRHCPIFKNIQLKSHLNYWMIANDTGFVKGFTVLETDADGLVGNIVTPHQPGGSPGPFLENTAPRVTTGTFQSARLDGYSQKVFKFNAMSSGVYEFETRSLLKTDCRIRSVMRVRLNGFQVKANGDNIRLRQYLTPGTYFVTVSSYEGPVRPVELGVRKIDQREWGQLAPEETACIDLGIAGIPWLNLHVAETADFDITTSGQHGLSGLRLVDDKGWPVRVVQGNIQSISLEPGDYGLMTIPSPYTSEVRVKCSKVNPTEPVKGAGPHPLDLARGGHGYWELEEHPFHQWIFTLQADTTLNLSMTKGMSGKLIQVADSKDEFDVSGRDFDVSVNEFDVPDGSSFVRNMPAGNYELNVQPTIPDNMKTYTITVSTDPMVSGTQKRVSVPGNVDLRIADGWQESVVVVAVDAPGDTRGTLVLPDTTTGDRIRISDDNPGDWNPFFFIDSTDGVTSGDLRLYMDPVTDNVKRCNVVLDVPDVSIITIPVSGVQTIETSKNVLKLVPEKPVKKGYWLVSAESTGRLVMTGNVFPDVHQVSLIPAGNKMEVKLYDVDQRDSVLTVATTKISPSVIKEKIGQQQILPWKTAVLNNHPIAVAAMKLNDPGLLKIRYGKDVVMDYVDESRRNHKGDLIYHYLVSPESIDVNPPLKMERFILGKTDQEVITSARAIVDYTVEPGKMAVIRALNQSGVDDEEVVIQNRDIGLQRVDLQSLFPGASPDDLVLLKIKQASGTPVKKMVSPLGTMWINPGETYEIAPGRSGFRVSLGSDVEAFDPGREQALSVVSGLTESLNKSVTVVNTGTQKAGVAWYSDDSEKKVLSERAAEHGKADALFLGPEMKQSFVFDLNEVKTVGLSVSCSTGQVQARLVDVLQGTVMAEGLVINTLLNPGQYRLEVWIPSGAPPSVIQPQFVLETPHDLALFGREE